MATKIECIAIFVVLVLTLIRKAFLDRLFFFIDISLPELQEIIQFHYRSDSGWAFVLLGTDWNSVRIGIRHFTRCFQQVGSHRNGGSKWNHFRAGFREILAK